MLFLGMNGITTLFWGMAIPTIFMYWLANRKSRKGGKK